MDTEEYLQNIYQLHHRLDLFQSRVFLLRPEPGSISLPSLSPTHCRLCRFSFSRGQESLCWRRCLYFSLSAQLLDGVSGIARISSHFLRIHAKSLRFILRQYGPLILSLRALNDTFSTPFYGNLESIVMHPALSQVVSADFT